MLLSGDFATVQGQREGRNVTNSIHIGVASLQLRVHLRSSTNGPQKAAQQDLPGAATMRCNTAGTSCGDSNMATLLMLCDA